MLDVATHACVAVCAPITEKLYVRLESNMLTSLLVFLVGQIQQFLLEFVQYVILWMRAGLFFLLVLTVYGCRAACADLFSTLDLLHCFVHLLAHPTFRFWL